MLMGPKCDFIPLTNTQVDCRLMVQALMLKFGIEHYLYIIVHSHPCTKQ